MPYVDQRWLGGMLTNFKTVKGSHQAPGDMQAQSEAGIDIGPRRKLLFQRELAKLEKDIGGIQDMNALPDAIFDRRQPKIAVSEARSWAFRWSAWSTPTTTRWHRLRHPRQRRLGQGRGAVRPRMADAVLEGKGQRDRRSGRPPNAGDEFVEGRRDGPSLSSP